MLDKLICPHCGEEQTNHEPETVDTHCCPAKCEACGETFFYCAHLHRDYHTFTPEQVERSLDERLTQKNTAALERAIFEKKQSEYDEADIRHWLDEQGYAYTDDDVDQIHECLRDDWDADRSTWSNIQSAYYNSGLKLCYVEDQDDIRAWLDERHYDYTDDDVYYLQQDLFEATNAGAYPDDMPLGKRIELAFYNSGVNMRVLPNETEDDDND